MNQSASVFAYCVFLHSFLLLPRRKYALDLTLLNVESIKGKVYPIIIFTEHKRFQFLINPHYSLLHGIIILIIN